MAGVRFQLLMYFINCKKSPLTLFMAKDLNYKFSVEDYVTLADKRHK